MNQIDQEKEFLNAVIQQIYDERKKQIAALKSIPEEYKNRYADVKWGDEDLVKHLLNMYRQRLKILENLENSPYFGCFSFTSNSEPERTFRIGKTDIKNEFDMLVLDWRNPICSLYYGKSIGKVSYNAPAGEIYVNLTRKKQIIIKNGNIISIKDVDIVSEDELLQSYLDVNADNKMKIIVASIQAEQNNIIRYLMNKNLIVQGVAGSGKTSVALHRIAYMLYNSGDKNIDEHSFAIIGPNKYFLDYISTVLPDLDTKNVDEYTFEEIASEIIDEKRYKYETANEELKRFSDLNIDEKKAKQFKGTLEYKNCLYKFLEDYFNHQLKEGINFEEIELISPEYLRKPLLSGNNYYNSIKGFIKTTSKRIKDESELIYYKLVKPLMNELEQHPLNSEKRKEIIERMVLLKNMLENGCINELKVFFKPFLISPVNLYKLFLGNIEKYIQLNSSETEAFKSRTLKMIKKGIIPFEDSASICFFSLLYKDNSNYGHVKHVVIDEAQDYSLFQFDILRTLFSKSKFSIFGDLAQAIYSHRSIKSWEEVNELIFTDDCKISYLQKSYRTTMEITNGANYILRNLNLATAEPVIRSGSKIGFNECANDFERNQFYLQKINNFIESDYKSIGIICKDESEMHRIRAILIKLQIPYNYVTNSDISYNGGISLLTSPLAKGLEFDAVIINNASSTIYNPKSEIDMRLLYIAMTRPLHELEILYTGQLNTILQEVKNSNCKSENQEFNLAKRKKL